MIAYFKTLFDYDSHTNLAILDTMIASGMGTGKAAGLMAHMLAAQQVWLLRCKNHPLPTGPLWPDWSAEEMIEITGKNHQDWIDYLNELQDNDVDDTITYKNLRGDTFTSVIRDVLMHVINHGTHHRAQAGYQLKFAGVEQLPVTDYIFYTRGL
jgi:uncharacterized damage-inducible protein DinB